MKKLTILLSILVCILTYVSGAATPPPVTPQTNSTPRTNAPPPAPAATVTLTDFKLVGDLGGESASFTLTATAKVEGEGTGKLEVLSGPVALTDVGAHPKWQVHVDQNHYVLEFEREGKYPIQLKFDVAVQRGETWKRVSFQVAPGILQPIVLHGLGADTQFEFAGAARPERKGDDFVSFLPTDGALKLSWKEAKPQMEGRLFFAAEMLSQISVSPGLMRQVALFDFKVMQGELSRITLQLRGDGEVTGVKGDNVLAWNVVPGAEPSSRCLVVQFNQPQKDHFALQIQMQTPLGAFPQTAEAMQLRPDGATRFAGYFRIVNEGAVRLDVSQASGLSQISPEQFPESDVTRAAFRMTGNQRFVYRFSGADYALRIQADQILPELNVSEVLLYRLAENELTIEAQFELDIRDAPLRELLVRVPKGFSITGIKGVADWFPPDPTNANSELRLVYAQPLSGRQVVQLKLERNQPLGEAAWELPRVEVTKAKSVRGNVGVTAAAGYRLTPERTQALTEIGTAYFPVKVTGLQWAYRLSDPAWQATMRVERLPQTVQADMLHLFSIGEGIAYGSSIINYVVSGAPVSVFKVEAPEDVLNVRFTGKDIRTWDKTSEGYSVQLQTPVSGAYTLLVTYDRPFKATNDTLAFTGVRSLDARPEHEQGYTLVISAYQFQVKPTDVSSGLMALEPGEVPPEYRLFFDAPILAAYRYTSRPFTLKLQLSPLAQGDSLNQVVDRASLKTRISKEGQALTDVQYFVKNRGNPNFRLTLPKDAKLWTALVDGVPVVPVTDSHSDFDLIPLPQSADPNKAFRIDLKLASRSQDREHVSLAAPVVNAPVMLAQWNLEPDPGRRLVYQSGSLSPESAAPDTTGFAQFGRVFSGYNGQQAVGLLIVALLAMVILALAWRWSSAPGVYRYSLRHIAGTVLGLIALVFAIVTLSALGDQASQQWVSVPGALSFLAPVQQAGGPLTLEVSNVESKVAVSDVVLPAWPALLALAVWVYGLLAGKGSSRTAAWLVGWVLLAWAALRSSHGGVAYVTIISAFLVLHVLLPAARGLFQLPVKPKPTRPQTEHGATAAAAVTLLLCLLGLSLGSSGCMTVPTPTPAVSKVAVAESVSQDIRIEDKFAVTTAKIHWVAAKGEALPLLFEPAVLTSLSYPSNSLKIAAAPQGSRRAQYIVAEKEGAYDIEIRYELPVTKRDIESGIVLAAPSGLINRASLTAENLDVDVLSPQAVSVQRRAEGSNTVASLTLSPVNDAWVGWKPRSRDVKSEKAVFYADVTQLYVPSAGVIEGAHYVSIRPAQGQLSEMVFDVPVGASITDVTDPSMAPGAPGSMVSLWRFDPDAHKLRVTLTPAQSRPFVLLVRSQVATRPLPFEHSLGLLSVENAAGKQTGLLGIATGNEVQLESPPDSQLDPETAKVFSPINLDDFPANAAAPFQAQVAGLALKRAFHYSDTQGVILLKALAVKPDVQVEAKSTLSLGEDRVVLAVNATVRIERAGIFKLSFVMPSGFDVETISGTALSQWTEAKSEAGRIITLNLISRTLGQQQFAITLSGAGVKSTNAWVVPQVTFAEASKQRGTLLVVPEQGLRLQEVTAQSEGIRSIDPMESGIRQKGVLAFGFQQTSWKLALSVERVEAWTTVTSLQHATVNEAQIKIAANLQYQIENAGLKALHVWLPTNADTVQFQGEWKKDSVKMGEISNGMQQWEVQLDRRIIGGYLLKVTYQIPIAEQATSAILRGVRASDVSLQGGFVTVQSGGRLQVDADTLPDTLKPIEWQGIPATLKVGLPTTAANLTYRLVDADFALLLKIVRHQAAELLPGRVNKIDFQSVISDAGVMLTHVNLEMVPGDMRLLGVTLPKGAKNAHFWFAFVNRNGVWPWRQGDKILIPLDQQIRRRSAIPVEFFYSCAVNPASAGELDLDLLAPKFDLPLENLTWRVSLGEKWQVKKSENNRPGALSLEREEVTPRNAAADVQAYLATEKLQTDERTMEARNLYQAANDALIQGDPQQARRSFQAAYEMSMHDAPFNEDARVQLHNIKLQEALIGLNVRQATASASIGEPIALGVRFRDLRERKEINYTQQDAKDIIDRNTKDDNDAYMRVAERLIQQQDAAVSSATPIRASIPNEGRTLTFKRAVEVNPDADLNISLRATVVSMQSWGLRLAFLAGTALALALLAWLARRPESRSTSSA